MKILQFTFKNEAKWILLFNLGLIVLGVIRLVVIRVFAGIR